MQPNDLTRGLVRKRVVVHDLTDGRFEIRHRVPYLAFGKGRQVAQGSVVANKDLGAAVTALKAKQARQDTTIMGSQAILASVAGSALLDRLAPALARAQAQQGQAGRRPNRCPGSGIAQRDISIGEQHKV